jgi:hypothetical protein
MNKTLLLLVLTTSLFSCSTNEDYLQEGNTILGRWHPVGFEQTVIYEFTDDLRYTIYSIDGKFGGLETAIPNPNSWSLQAKKIVIDLNFGNISKLTLNFKCNGKVVDLVNPNGGISTYFRENYSNCNE